MKIIKNDVNEALDKTYNKSCTLVKDTNLRNSKLHIEILSFYCECKKINLTENEDKDNA